MESRIPKRVTAALHRGAVIVTPHERAARAVRSAWDLQQKSAGHSSWETPNVLSWRAWTARLWHLLQLDGETELTLLNPTQDHHLWTIILEQYAGKLSAPAVAALAKRCIDAHRRLETYIGDSRLRTIRNLSGRPFADWLYQLQERCRRGHLLPAAELDRALAQRISAGVLPLLPSGELLLFGFDELPPAQEALCTAWQEAGGHYQKESFETLESAGGIVAAETQEDELRRFATWARAHIENAASTRIALVVSNLDEQRDELDATLRDVLSFGPEDRSSHALEFPERPLFELSLGRPLDSEPLVQAALDLVRWTQASLPLPSITRLLLSPHFGAARSHHVEVDVRSHIDRRLRRGFRLRPEASLAEVIAVCDELRDLARCLMLRRGLEALLHSSLTHSAETEEAQLRPSTDWVAAIRSTLAGARWGLSSSSYNFQLRQRWDNLLDELGTLDLLEPGYTFSRFLRLLEQRASEVVFAPESRDAPVQVLGPLEAAGQRFDALWVLGSSHLQWPPARAASSLLPQQLQQDSGAPGADRQRERQWAAQLTSRLTASATEVVFSFARQTSIGTEQHLSPLLEALSLPTLSDTSVHTVLLPRIPLERFVDTSPVAPLASSAVEGGARLLQLQAACGFRAFAEIRLRAQELDHRLLGMDPRERGTAVHAALDAIWRDLKSHERLQRLSPEERHRSLDEAVEHGLRSASAQAGNQPWETQYLDVQRTRLRRLLEAWLDKESGRSPFHVLGSEITLDHVPVGPLHLSVRIDRLDLVDGHHVLLDYKTSKTSAAAWHGDRPDQPQMLLYAVLAAAGHLVASPDAPQPALGALAFANIVAGPEMSLNGVQQDGLALMPLTNRAHNRNIEEQVAQWTEVIGRLAAEFAAGDAHVDPANYPTTCQHCAQRLLCRLAPELLLEEEATTADYERHDG